MLLKFRALNSFIYSAPFQVNFHIVANGVVNFVIIRVDLLEVYTFPVGSYLWKITTHALHTQANLKLANYMLFATTRRTEYITSIIEF